MGVLDGLGGKDGVLEVARRHVTPEFLQNLKDGSLLVPAELLEERLRAALADDGDAAVERVSCSERGIAIDLRVSGSAVTAVVPVVVTVHAIELSSRSQTVTVLVAVDRAVRGGLLCGPVRWIVGGVVSRIVAERIADLPAVSSVTELDGGRRQFVVDLGSIPAVRKLATPVLLGKSALDLLTVGGTEHRKDGLLIRLGLSPFLKGIIGG